MENQDNLLMKKIAIAILVFIVLSFLMITFFSNRLEPKKSNLNKKIEKEKTIFILITDSKCSTCKEIKNYLKDNNINYIEASNDKKEDIKTLLKYNITKSDIEVPTLVFIKDKELVSSLPNIDDYNKIDLFLDNYNTRSD